jgi:hypothetical protein
MCLWLRRGDGLYLIYLYTYIYMFVGMKEKRERSESRKQWMGIKTNTRKKNGVYRILMSRWNGLNDQTSYSSHTPPIHTKHIHSGIICECHCSVWVMCAHLRWFFHFLFNGEMKYSFVSYFSCSKYSEVWVFRI